MTSECTIGEGETNEGQFIFFNEANTTDYEEANRKCKEVGAILAPVKTVDLMEKIANFLKPCDPNPWLIGIKYDNDQENGVWSDGKPYKESEDLSIIAPRKETNPKCVVLRKSYDKDSFWLLRSSCEKKRFICFRHDELGSDHNTDASKQIASLEVPFSSGAESNGNKSVDVTEKKKPSPKPTSKVSTTSTIPVRKTNRRFYKRITTNKSLPSIMTSSKPVISPSLRRYNITPQMTTTSSSSFFTNVTSNPTLLYSLIGGATFLLLMIFIATFWLCKKSKKKKKKRKTNVGGEEVEMTVNDLYQSVNIAQDSDMGIYGRMNPNGQGQAQVSESDVYAQVVKPNGQGQTPEADVYAQLVKPNGQGNTQVPAIDVYAQVVKPNRQGQAQVPATDVYAQVM